MTKKLSPQQLKYNLSIENNMKENKKDSKEKLKESYELLKKKFYSIDDSETLKKYQILSKAYKLGKEINGSNFSVATLSMNFDIPYTTCKRVLSLDKANKKTWKLINSKKISVFKVAQVLMTKNTRLQDEIIERVIKESLSTYQIKKIKMFGGKDDKLVRLEAAVQEGFTRNDSTYRSLINHINKMRLLLMVDKSKLPADKIPKLIEELESLNVKITMKIAELK